MPLIRIDCFEDEWREILKNAVQDGKEAELMNFDYAIGGELCEILVINHAMHFVADPKAHAGFLKKLK